MVSGDVQNLVYDVKLSSVVPARVTGDDKVRELTNTDLAVKLHYIRGLYFFDSEASRGIDIFSLKKPMFQWLDLDYPASGRIRRRSEGGRPFVKCNDGGVRIVEAWCRKTLAEWLAMEDQSVNDQLVYNHVLGPDLPFSPLVFVQFTWFKCGGLSVGLSCAHVLGDAFSASSFINMWGQIMAGHVLSQALKMPSTGNCQSPLPPSTDRTPTALKMVDPVGDHWVTANNCKMEVHTLHVSAKKLDLLLSGSSRPKPEYFTVLSALIWKSLAKVRGELGPRVVTICTKNCQSRENELFSNSQVIGVVEANFSVEKADLSQLTKLIEEKMVDERSMIEELMERENGRSDFILYGGNLTFVNLEEANIYELQLQGKRPVFANYTIAGVGQEGVVLVLPTQENITKDSDDSHGRMVTLILPKNEIVELKNELMKEY